jgi:hypothetical protein
MAPAGSWDTVTDGVCAGACAINRMETKNIKIYFIERQINFFMFLKSKARLNVGNVAKHGSLGSGIN